MRSFTVDFLRSRAVRGEWDDVEEQLMPARGVLSVPLTSPETQTIHRCMMGLHICVES